MNETIPLSKNGFRYFLCILNVNILDDDPVVEEHDIFLSKELADQL